MCLKGRRCKPEREVSRGRSSLFFLTKGRTRESVIGHVDANDRKSDACQTRGGCEDASGETVRSPISDEVNRPQDESDNAGQGLLDRAFARENLKRAWKRVKANKGAAGVDGLDIEQTAEYLLTRWPTIREQLLSGVYRPSPVRRVVIPKPDGGQRELGIPTVTDRLIQQALLQVLQPELDPTFS